MALINEKFAGNQAEFARAINKAPAQVNQWVNGVRKLGGSGARDIEMALGLPQGYFNGTLVYDKNGTSTVIKAEEPNLPATILEVMSLMQATDDIGREHALAAVRFALAAYKPAKKNSTQGQVIRFPEANKAGSRHR